MAYRSGDLRNSQIVMRYVPFRWWDVLRVVVVIAIASVPVFSSKSDLSLRLLPILVVVLAIAAFIPIVTIRARIEGGHVVTRGYRWPATEVMWSCTINEAAAFEEERFDGERNTKFHRLALRTSDDRLLALTERAYFGQGRPEVARLNAWLESVRSSR